jgi:hypothetical protein
MKRIKSEWSLKKPLYLDKKDKRYSKHLKQLKTYGFSDGETWSLDSVICRFILPRLIRFREIAGGYPGGEMTRQKWDETLDKMIFSFDWSVNCDKEIYSKISQHALEQNWKKYEEGMALFAKWFRQLWW